MFYARIYKDYYSAEVTYY